MLTTYWNEAEGRATYYGVQAYTEGDCWILAYALHELTSLPLALTGTALDWDHVMLALPNGEFLDITGICGKEAMLYNYGSRTNDITYVPDTWASSWKAYKNYITDNHNIIQSGLWKLHALYPGGLRTARAVAKKLIATLDPNVLV